MAKTKVSKRLSKPSKVTKEQLEQMQSLISNINKTQFEMGGMQARIHELLHLHTNINGKIKELQDEFQKEYGTVNIDIKDGTIKYNENDGTYNTKNNSR